MMRYALPHPFSHLTFDPKMIALSFRNEKPVVDLAGAAAPSGQTDFQSPDAGGLSIFSLSLAPERAT
jgi:hypothetical protein